ncbi:hypothetical protein AC529_05275, partial [Thermobifida cellulosilytica TB100]
MVPPELSDLLVCQSSFPQLLLKGLCLPDEGFLLWGQYLLIGGPVPIPLGGVVLGVLAAALLDSFLTLAARPRILLGRAMMTVPVDVTAVAVPVGRTAVPWLLGPRARHGTAFRAVVTVPGGPAAMTVEDGAAACGAVVTAFERGVSAAFVWISCSGQVKGAARTPATGAGGVVVGVEGQVGGGTAGAGAVAGVGSDQVPFGKVGVEFRVAAGFDESEEVVGGVDVGVEQVQDLLDLPGGGQPHLFAFVGVHAAVQHLSLIHI